MKLFRKCNKKAFLIIWIAIVSALLVTSIVVADYMRVKYSKKVVSLQSGSGAVFSSNYLMMSETPTTKIIPFNTIPSSELVTVDLVICNYEYGEPTSKNCTEDITYDLKVWLVNPNNETVTANTYTISAIDSLSDDDENPEMVDLSSYTTEQTCLTYEDQTLSRSGHSDKYYRLTFPKSQLTVSNVQIAVKAVVNEDDYSSDVKTLSSLIGIQYLDITTDRSWNGTVAEYKSYGNEQGSSPSDFSGFNFVAEGTAAGTVRISWNPTIVSISQLFNENAGFVSNIAEETYPSNYSVESLRGWKYIDIEVDPTDDTQNSKTRYNFEFYKGTNGWDGLSWNQLNESIILDFTANE